MSDPDDLWSGTCPICEKRYQFTDGALRQTYPEHVDTFEGGEFTTGCPSCGASVDVFRTIVKVVPFSAWDVLPAAEGCPECGLEHAPHLPHDQTSLLYQYRFRSEEGKAGREERWPTWKDAMAHCTPDMQADWVRELAKHGVVV